MIIELPEDEANLLQFLKESLGSKETAEQIATEMLVVSLREVSALRHQLVRFRKVPPVQWARLVEALARGEVARRAEFEKDLKKKKKRKERERVRYLNEVFSKINVKLLEIDGRNPSGFKGVYQGNGGWRAAVTRDGHTKFLPTRTEPALAAWDRLQWYRKYGLPYGEEERAFERFEQMSPGMAKDQAIAISRVSDAYFTKGGPHPTEDIVQAELESIRIKQALADNEERNGKNPRTGRPKKRVEVLARRAGVVTFRDDDVSRVVVEHEDGTALSYMPLSLIIVDTRDRVAVGEKLGEVEGATTKIYINEVPLPSRIKQGRVPLEIKLTPMDAGYADTLPTPAERAAMESPDLPVTAEDAEAAKQALIAKIRKMKVDAAKTPTERLSEKIEHENEEREAAWFAEQEAAAPPLAPEDDPDDIIQVELSYDPDEPIDDDLEETSSTTFPDEPTPRAMPGKPRLVVVPLPTVQAPPRPSTPVSAEDDFFKAPDDRS